MLLYEIRDKIERHFHDNFLAHPVQYETMTVEPIGSFISLFIKPQGSTYDASGDANTKSVIVAVSCFADTAYDVSVLVDEVEQFMVVLSPDNDITYSDMIELSPELWSIDILFNISFTDECKVPTILGEAFSKASSKAFKGLI